MIVSHFLERGTVNQKISRKFNKTIPHFFILHSLLVYFDSYDINGDQIITRDDLEKCLPPTVESHELIQQLLQQWDVVRPDFPRQFLQFLFTF